jgi:hypothetical protein
MLRERLRRFLPADSTQTGQVQRAVRPLLSDMEVVELLLNLEFVAGSDIARARVLYEQASQVQIANEVIVLVESGNAPLGARQDAAAPASGTSLPPPEVAEQEPPDASASTPAEHRTDGQNSTPSVSVRIIPGPPPSLERLSPPPSFEELVEQGWIRTSWGRFSVQNAIAMAVLRSPSDLAPAFRTLVKIRTQDEFRLSNPVGVSGVVQEVAQRIVAGQCQPGEIHCVSRPWIAARLWDTSPKGEGTGDVAQRISHWVDRWTFLNWPVFAISTLLEPTSMDAFVDAALGVLTATETNPGWEEFRRAARNPVALLYPHRANDSSIVPPLPLTTIDRIEWLSRGEPQVAFHDLSDNRATTLLAALLNEVQEETLDPRRLAPRLMETVVGRPVYLQLLVLRAQRAPVLLADMLMAPTTCPLACSLIASWEARGNGWNRDFQAGANQATALLAYEDAIALLGGHLDARQISADELAALYLHVYRLASEPHKSPRHYAQLTLLREEIAGTSSEIQDSVVAALLGRAEASDNPLSAFCASLDLASEGGCVDRIDAKAMVSIYADVLMPLGESLGVKQMELDDARTLVTLAFKSDATRSRFVGAVNVPAWLQSGPSSLNEQYTFKHLLARRVRLQIRVLCRAIAGWPTDIPRPLVDALTQTVHAGATDQPQRGRIDAFVLELGLGMQWSPQERPIALDLAAALRRLEGTDLQRLINELCQVEEPVVLAGIVANTPPALNEQIKTHLLTLTPRNSSEVLMLPAMQARVEALLNAELPDLAEVFIAAEREAAPGRAIPNRAMTALRANLLALFVRGDWAAITSFVLPALIRDPERRDANDVVLFYQALSELRKAGGNATAAEAIFFQLTQRHRGVAAYQVNLFASRVQRLLVGNALGLLSGNDLSDAKRYLSEVQREVRPLLQHSASDLKALDSNRAMLLLAAGRPQDGLQVLLELRETNFDSRMEGFRALALARIGSKREALALLTQTERVFGRTEFLSAIRENIDTNRPFATAPSLSLYDDPVPGLRQAFEAFARLGHVEQAEVLQARGQFDLYVLEQVRGACASVVALAPMMRELGMVRNEDDISGVLKQVLLSRLLLVQWAVTDQSRGGFSRTGGVGERDIVVSKGSATLAVLEALIVDSVETVNLTTHFNKLLGYDTCRIFFHVTYVRRANCSGIINHLKTACTTPPAGIGYVRSHDLEDFDSMPIGFIAHYNIDSRDAAVVFLVLDMGQRVQRATAAAQ